MVGRKTRTNKKQKAFDWRSLVCAEVDREAVDFANEIFYRARVLSFPCGGRTLWLALHAWKDGSREEANLQLNIGSHSLRVGIVQLSDLALLDPRFSTLALEVYEENLQKLLVEALVDPLLTVLEQSLGDSVSLDRMEICTQIPEKLPPFAIHFALYAANPHEGEFVQRLLAGSAAMDKKLATLLLQKIRKVPTVRYRAHPTAVPRCLRVLASLPMATDELLSLRAGDVILLPTADGTEQTLLGIGSYAIICAQDGNQMTVKAIQNL